MFQTQSQPPVGELYGANQVRFPVLRGAPCFLPNQPLQEDDEVEEEQDAFDESSQFREAVDDELRQDEEEEEEQIRKDVEPQVAPREPACLRAESPGSEVFNNPSLLRTFGTIFQSPGKHQNGGPTGIQSKPRGVGSRPSSRTRRKEKVVVENTLFKFDLKKIPRDGTMVFIAPRRTGKSVAINTVGRAMNFDRVVLVCNGRDEASYWGSKIKKAYIYTSFEDDVIREILNGQNKLWKALNRGSDKTRFPIDLLFILEDFSSCKKVMNSPLLADIVSNCRRIRICFMMSSQYLRNIVPNVLTNFDVSFLLKEIMPKNRKLLHENFGGNLPRDAWDDLFSKATNKRRIMVCDKAEAGNPSYFSWFEADMTLPETFWGSFESQMFSDLYYIEESSENLFGGQDDTFNSNETNPFMFGENIIPFGSESQSGTGEPKTIISIPGNEDIPMDRITAHSQTKNCLETYCSSTGKIHSIVSLVDTFKPE